MKLHNRLMHIAVAIMLCTTFVAQAGLITSKEVHEMSDQEYDDAVQETMRYFAEKQRASYEKRVKEAAEIQRANREKRVEETSAHKSSPQPDTNYLLEFLKKSPIAID